MAQFLLQVPEKIEREARAEAIRTQQRIEDVLQEWLERYTDELPIELLADERILELSEMQMSEYQQRELSELLALNRENQLSSEQRKHLDDLMRLYGEGMMRKAEALKVAVQRGLRQPLSN
jgi:hypothetical protein